MNRGLEDEQGAIPAAISIVDVLNGMRRRKFLVFGMTFAAFLMGLSVVNLLRPVYTAESKILVGNLETPFDKVQSVQIAGADLSVSERDLETQMAVMRSDDLGRQVIAALKLHENPEFNSLLNGMGTVSKLKLVFGFGEDPRLKTPEERALVSYNDDLTVYQVPASNVVAIKVGTSKPKIAADIANTLAEIYVNFTRESGTQPTERARQWLAQQIDGLRKKVAASDAAVEQFRAQAGLFQGQSSTLGSQELSELNSQITLAEAAKTDAESRAESIRALLSNKGTVDASSDVLASAVIQTLKQEQTAVQRNVAELSAVYLSNHPKMIAANKQLDNINRRIRGEALKIVEGLEEQATIAASREQSLRDSLDKAKGKASTSNLDDVKLKALEREAQADRVLLETMLARYAEATARLDPSAQPGFARIIQSAGAPKSPSFPKKGPMAVLITMAGFCLGLGLSFLLEIMAAATRLNERIFRAQNPVEEVALPATSGVAPVAPAIAHEAPAQVAQASWQPPPVTQPALAVLPAVLSPAALVATSSLEPVAAWFGAEIRKPVPPSLAVTSMGAGPGDAASAALALGRLYADRGKRVEELTPIDEDELAPEVARVG